MYRHKEGIVLRKIERRDLLDLYNLKQESWWGTHRASICNMEDQERWFASMPDNMLVMIGERECFPLGVAVYTNIDWINRSLHVSGSIYEWLRKAGVAKASFAAGVDFAFEILNMRRLEAEVLETNIASQKIQLDYLGFKIEGRKRQAVYKSGRYYDSIMTSLLRCEWESQDRVKNYGDTCNYNCQPNQVVDGCLSKSIAPDCV